MLCLPPNLFQLSKWSDNIWPGESLEDKYCFGDGRKTAAKLMCREQSFDRGCPIKCIELVITLLRRWR